MTKSGILMGKTKNLGNEIESQLIDSQSVHKSKDPKVATLSASTFTSYNVNELTDCM